MSAYRDKTSTVLWISETTFSIQFFLMNFFLLQYLTLKCLEVCVNCVTKCVTAKIYPLKIKFQAFPIKGFWIPWSRLFPGLGTLHCNGGSSRLVRSKRVRPWKRSGEEEGWHSLHSVQLRGGSCRVKFSATMTRPPPWQDRQGLLRKEWDLGAAIPATRTYSCMCKTDFLNLERKQSLYLDMLKIALWW